MPIRIGAEVRKSSSEGKAGPKSRRQYTMAYQRESVRLSRDRSTSPAQVARDLGISGSLLSSWGTVESTEGGDAFRGHGKRNGHIRKSRTAPGAVSVAQIKAAKTQKYQRYFKVFPTPR